MTPGSRAKSRPRRIDRPVHPEKNAWRLRRYLNASRSPAWFVEVVPGANHLFRPSDLRETRVERRWANGFWDALDEPRFWRRVLDELAGERERSSTAARLAGRGRG